MLDTRVITPRIYRKALAAKVVLHRGRLYDAIREPYFFGYVRDKLIEAYGAQQVRSGGLKVYTTIIPRYQRLAETAIKETLDESDDPASALISISPRTGAIRAMAAIVPNRPKNQFNLLSQARRQPGSTFKTFVLTAAVEQGINPDSTYYVSAPFTYKIHPAGNCEDDTLVVRQDVRERLLRLELDPQCDAALRQHGLRAAHARRRAREGRRHRAAHGRSLAARRERRVRSGDRARLDRGLAARSRVLVRDARGRWRPRRADGDSPGRAPGRNGRHGSGLGQAEATSRDLGGHGGRRHAHPRAERPVGDGHARRLRPAGGREDRDGRAERRRVVRRATRPSSRRPCGSATRARRSRSRACTASR